MSWELKFEGRATDFVPDLLRASGAPGPTAQLAKEALWVALQGAGERNPRAWVNARAQGYENKEEPGTGQMTIMISVKGDAPSAIDQELMRQQPVDLLRSHGAASSTAPETAGHQAQVS